MKYAKKLPDALEVVGSGDFSCFVYALVFHKEGHRHDGQVRYIGKSNNPLRRFARHMSGTQSGGRVKKSVLSHGKHCFSLCVLVEIRAETATEAECEAFRREIDLIRHYRTADGDCGLNLTVGGEGQSLVGEARARKSELARANLAEIKSRPEVRKKYSETSKDRFSDPDFRQRFMQMVNWRKNDPEIEARRLISLQRHHADPEFRRQRISRFIASVNTDAARQANRASLRVVMTTPEYRQKQREQATAYYADPEVRAARRSQALALHSDEEFSRRYRAGIAQRYADPVNVASHAEKTRARHCDPGFSLSAKLGIALRWAKRHHQDGNLPGAEKQIARLKSLVGEAGDNPATARVKAAAQEFLNSLAPPPVYTDESRIKMLAQSFLGEDA